MADRLWRKVVTQVTGGRLAPLNPLFYLQGFGFRVASICAHPHAAKLPSQSYGTGATGISAIATEVPVTITPVEMQSRANSIAIVAIRSYAMRESMPLRRVRV